MTRWKPISAAPKDGTVIDMWFPKLGGRVNDVWWDKTYGWIGLAFEYDTPTHWIENGKRARPSRP